MFVVDTNVLLHAVNGRSAEHKPCRTFLDRLRGGRLPWYLSWPVVYEFLRVSTHPRVFEHPLAMPQAWSWVQALLASPTLSLLVAGPRHAEIATLTFGEVPGVRGNLLHDAHTAILMREHGLRRIATLDTDFSRFPFLEVVSPLAIEARA